MKLRIVTWNMAWWSHKAKVSEAWDYLFDELQADVALLTEMGDPDQSKCPFPYAKWQQIGMGRLYWGSGIVSRYPLTDCYLPSSVGALMTAKLSIEGITPVSLISMYGLQDKATNSYVANLHRYLSDLMPILQGQGRRVIIGGDWNADLQLDGRNGNTTNANRLFFERLADFGLTDCLAPWVQYPVQTHRHISNTEYPWQLDHIYATQAIAKAVVSGRVVDTPEVREISDHNPIEIVVDV